MSGPHSGVGAVPRGRTSRCRLILAVLLAAAVTAVVPTVTSPPTALADHSATSPLIGCPGATTELPRNDDG